MSPIFEPIPAQAPAVAGHAPVPGGQLWYWDTGGTGEPVVLCHPASQSAHVWLYQQPVFSAAGYRVIGWSRRGHLGSEQQAGGERGTVVGDLAALLDHLGIVRAHLLGAAAGGIGATGFAVACPHRVISLVLAGTIVAPDEDEWRRFYARLGIAAVRDKVSTAFLELGPSYRATSPEGVARLAALEHVARPAGTLVQPLGAKVDWASLGRLDTPVLMLTGEADLYAPPPLQQLIASRLRRVETTTLREVGHAPYWEAPSAFNSLVLDFLSRHSDAPTCTLAAD